MPNPDETLSILLNGEAREFVAGSTVADLVKQLDIASGRFAVELNREIVPKSQLEHRALQSGDKLEIIGFVGGG